MGYINLIDIYYIHIFEDTMTKKSLFDKYLDEEKRLDIDKLQKSPLKDLHLLAKELKIDQYNQLKNNELIFKILEENPNENGLIKAQGCLEIVSEGFGYLRTNNYLPSLEDIYVSNTQIRKFQLQTGDIVSGMVRPPKDNERYFSLLRVEHINSEPPEEISSRTLFTNLIPVYPYEQLKLETSSDLIAGRIMDLLCPIGKGQRSLIVSLQKQVKHPQ